MGQVISWDQGRVIRENLWAHGQSMVFTNGPFDLLHIGHLRMLRRARALGDLLIVGLNSDSSTRALRGHGHPLVPQEERAELLAALTPVDFVIIFDEVSAERLVDHLRPDVYVAGGHYSDLGEGNEASGERLPPEGRVVLGYGGTIEILPDEEGSSTSDLIRKVLNTHGRSDSR